MAAEPDDALLAEFAFESGRQSQQTFSAAER
jgi:hypothetical protein